MKNILLFGSTGSIGQNTIKVAQNLKGFNIIGIAAHKNYRLLAEQAGSLGVRSVGIISDHHYKDLRASLKNRRIFCGETGLTEMADRLDADIVVAAFSSSIGTNAILRSIEKKMRICLATKEILVSYGEIVMKMIREHNAEIIPIDSEHSAIYQCLEGRKPGEVLNIILTATGGPFLNRPTRGVKKSDVLRHPVWKMGEKITVDSATMMNKGLEVIEAHHLFSLPMEKIKVVIHPEAFCHSLVQFVDGSILGQLSSPDMKLPIQFALTAPDRVQSCVPYLDIRKVTALHFKYPDPKKFPCLDLAFKALRSGRSMPAVLNGANDVAVKCFLEGKLKFEEIPFIISETMKKHMPRSGGLKDYYYAEQWARTHAAKLVMRRSKHKKGA